MADVRASEPELVGVSPTVIAFFMTIVTLIVPLGFYTSWFSLYDLFIGPGTYALFWAIGSSTFGLSRFHFFSFSYMQMAFTLSIFNLLYVAQMVRYYQGKITRDRVIQTGVISLMFPELVVLISSLFYYRGLVWPIPAQFIAGLIFLYMIPGPEPKSTPIE